MRTVKFLLFLLLGNICGGFLSASPFGEVIVQIAENLSGQYRAEVKSSLRPRLAIAEFTISGPSLKDKNYHRLLEDEFSSVFSRSDFVLVERGNLAPMLREMELHQKGLVEGEEREVLLDAADYLLYGTLTESGQTALLTVKLTDATSGKTYSASENIPLGDLVAGKEKFLDRQYQMANAAAVSIFMETTLCGDSATPNPIPAIDRTGISRLPGVELKYRFFPGFALSTGIARIYGHAERYDSLTADGIKLGSAQTGPFTVIVSGNSYIFNAYFSVPLNRRVHLFAMPGVEYYVITVNGYFDPSMGNGFGINEVGPMLNAENFAFRIMAGMEVFATPRLSFSGKAGYVYLPISVPSGAIQHINGLPNPIDSDLGGFSYSLATTIYF